MKNKNLAGNLFTKKALVQSESSLSKSIEEYLNRKRIFNLRLNSGKVQVIHASGHKSWVTLCQKGTPDRFFIYKGFHVFIELKKKGGKLSDDQVRVHEDISKNGGYVRMIDNFDDFLEIINWIEVTAK